MKPQPIQWTEQAQALQALEALTMEGANEPTRRRPDQSRTGNRALLRLANGEEIRCEVDALSSEGAYLVRSSSTAVSPSLRAGDRLTAYIFRPGASHIGGVSITAEVARVESGGGPGIALRFARPTQSPPTHISANPFAIDIDDDEGIPENEANAWSQGITISRSAGLTTTQAVAVNTKNILRPVIWAGVIGVNVGLVLLVNQWLSTLF